MTPRGCSGAVEVVGSVLVSFRLSPWPTPSYSCPRPVSRDSAARPAEANRATRTSTSLLLRQRRVHGFSHLVSRFRDVVLAIFHAVHLAYSRDAL